MKDIVEQLKAFKEQIARRSVSSPADEVIPGRAALLGVAMTGTGPLHELARVVFKSTPPVLADYFQAAKEGVAIDGSRWGQLRALIAAELGAGHLTSAGGKRGCAELCRIARLAAEAQYKNERTKAGRDKLITRMSLINLTSRMVDKLTKDAEIARMAAEFADDARPDRVGVKPLAAITRVVQDVHPRSTPGRGAPGRQHLPYVGPFASTSSPKPAVGVRTPTDSLVARPPTVQLGGSTSAAPEAAPAQVVPRARVSPPAPAVWASVAPRAKKVATPSAPVKRVEAVSRVFKPLPRTAATRTGLFREPAAWVANGGKTQYVSDGFRGTVDIVIGIDFGTSFTKAAVGLKDKVFPVSWGGVSACAPDYLLPSEYSELEDGTVFIGQHPRARIEQIKADLKLPFINHSLSSSAVDRAAVFLALALRYVRAWVYQRHGAKLGRAKIRWQLNIGAPSNGLERADLTRYYRTLAATAWRRSLSSDLSRLSYLHGNLWSEGEPLEDLFAPYVCPEFVAQMAGYVKSPQRQRGLHALVDVGGGTFDVVTFIVHRVEEEDTFPFLVPEIHPLGTHGLLQNRLALADALPETINIDELAPVQAAPEFARSIGLKEAHVCHRDEVFGEELHRVIASVFETTRRRRYRLSDAWRYGVRTFFTGGGSSFDLYENSIKAAQVPSSQGLVISRLPPHPRLDGFSGDLVEYQRVSVACGLAQDVFSLGRIVPAKEVQDDIPVSFPHRRRPDRDELYPK